MAGNQLTVLMRLNSQSSSGFRKGVSIVKGLRLVATAALALPLMCSGLIFSWTLTKKALAQTSAAQGRSGAVSKGQEAPADSAIERANLQRTGVFHTKAPDNPSGITWESPRLFIMKRGRYDADMPKLLNQGGGEMIFFPGGNWFHSYEFEYSDPLVYGDTIYFSLNLGDGYLFAVDAKTGQSKWTLQRKKGYFTAPAVANDILYAGADDGVVHALDLMIHREKWRFTTPDKSKVTAAPSVSNGVVFFGTTSGRFYALSAQTGEVKWTFETGQPTYWLTPAFADGMVVCGANSGALYTLETETGKQVWKFTTKDKERINSVVISNEVAFVTDYQGNVLHLDLKTGEKKHNAGKDNKAGSVLAVDDNTIYFGGWHGGNIYAVDAMTGEERWKFRTEEPCNSPAIADGVVYFTCEDKKLYAVDAKTGRRHWTIETKNIQVSNPVIADGTIYFIGDSGKVYAVR